MKRWLMNGIFAGAIAVSAFALADAQGDGHRGPGGGAGFRRGGPGGLGGLARIADLTDEQRKQVQAILQEERSGREDRRADMDLRRQLHAEILADAPDEQKVDALRRQVAQAQEEGLTRQIALERKIAQILTPEQRAKARERLAEGPPRRQ